MKILRIYRSLPPKVGGMEKHIYHLSKIQSIEDQVSIYYNFGDSTSPKDVRVLQNIKVYKIKPAVLGIVFFYVAVIAKLVRCPNRFDVVHIHGDWSSLLFIQVVKKITKARITVFTFHGQATEGLQHRILLPLLLRRVHLIFSTGHQSAKILSERTHRKVIVQPSGIDDVFFEPCCQVKGDSEFTVITVANLFQVKNIQMILEIAVLLPAARFLIVGEGPERENLQNFMIASNIKNVSLVGFRSPSEVKRLYCLSNCFLLTSLAEGTPTSILEAMATGLPIVTSNAGGIMQIIKDFENGFVVPENEKFKFIEKLNLIKDDRELTSYMASNNRLLSKNYAWTKVASTISFKIKELLDEKS
jgi:glycosyltransferase involved in cell wall biosynthesis